eukprot:107549_1
MAHSNTVRTDEYKRDVFHPINISQLHNKMHTMHKDMINMKKVHLKQLEVISTQNLEELNEIQMELEKNKEESQAEIDVLQNQNNDLEQQLEVVSTQNLEELNEMQVELEKNKKESQAEIDVLQNQNNDLKQQLESINEEKQIDDQQNPYENISVIVRINEESTHWNFEQDNPSMSLLQQFVSKQFKICFFSLTYTDTQQNEIQIENDDDLHEAFKYSKNEYESKLEINVNKHIPADAPLVKFTVKDICDTLKQWIYNDINYKKHTLKIQNIFNIRKLNGQKINHLTTDDLKCIIKEDILKFITSKTLDITFQYFEKWRNENEERFLSKTADEIAGVLFNYPFQRLIDKINYEQIDGKKMADILENETKNIFKSDTGWHQRVATLRATNMDIDRSESINYCFRKLS